MPLRAAPALLRPILLLIAGLCLFGPVAADDSENAARSDLTPEQARKVEAVLAPPADFAVPEAFEMRSSGAGTNVRRFDRDAFSQPSANLDFQGRQDFAVGNGIFRKVWVSSPATTKASDGLGPLFNARSCQRCHLKDGRGDAESTGLVLRFSPPDGTYGAQVQDASVQDFRPEADIEINYDFTDVTLDDGTIVVLRRPVFSLSAPGFGALADERVLSPRLAPPMIGLGLVEAITDADLIANTANGGTLRVLPGPEGERIGRFGWKAEQATLRAQAAAAFSTDMGLSTSLHPSHGGDCTQAQPTCHLLPDGGTAADGSEGPEVSDELLALVTFYSAHLAVPARRDVDEADVLAGKALFHRIGCASCHRPKYVTDAQFPDEARRFQLIWPYSDFLLHDMGDGLADPSGLPLPAGAEAGEAQPAASGTLTGPFARLWRTPPLWGIGLTETVNGNTNYLHDGRARTLEEAILWHGGTGAEAQATYRALAADQRKLLLRFLGSL